MLNLIAFIKDVIDLVRNPPGDAVAACEITPETKDLVLEFVGSEGSSYIKYGDFYLEFENSSTIAPSKEFHKHYALDGPPMPNGLTRVRTIKPL